jgi:glycosyltransferase involved in cell wall biosynthesis
MSFSDYFADQFGIKNTVYLPQYAESSFTSEECEKKLDDIVNVMFAGNIGAAQSVETIIKASAICRDITNLRWHIVGDGSEYDACRSLAEELGAPVIFYGRRPVEEMPRFYSMADAMLVTMKKDPTISLTLPGKVQSYMAAAKPIIGCIDGETDMIINESQCGLCAPAENEQLLAECVRRIVSDRESLKIYAKKSETYYQTHFSKDKIISKLNELLLEICGD